MTIVETLKNLTSAIGDIITEARLQAKENRQELIRGSVLDPLNHPSYSPEEVKARAEALAKYEKELAKLNKKFA